MNLLVVKAVHYWMDKENIPLEKNILVITDDLNLSFGTIRITKEVMVDTMDSKKILT
jgi:peptidyl-tRNA hydrolase